ncbi:MAG: dUTPase [Clostridia bacterium]|nr:dUTPase [Clostridia bacterium]
MEDKLDTIFRMQKLLDEDIMTRRNLDFPYEVWMQKDILACMDELTELLNELNWKWWKNEKPLDPDAIKGELVDVLHFFVSMCIRSGMSAQDLLDGYLAKNQENFDRQHGKSSKPGYEVTSDGKGLSGK